MPDLQLLLMYFYIQKYHTPVPLHSVTNNLET